MGQPNAKAEHHYLFPPSIERRPLLLLPLFTRHLTHRSSLYLLHLHSVLLYCLSSCIAYLGPTGWDSVLFLDRQNWTDRSTKKQRSAPVIPRSAGCYSGFHLFISRVIPQCIFGI